MSTEIYDNPAAYEGKEWYELLKAMNARDIKRTLKTAYRRVGKQIADIARQDLASSGLRNGDKMKKNIRVRVYPRGGGFMITVKPHGKQGYYKRSQDGAGKPVVMWASEGTKDRYARHGKGVFPIGNGGFRTMHGNSTGRMPEYPFLRNAESQGKNIVEQGVVLDIEKAVWERLGKSGWI